MYKVLDFFEKYGRRLGLELATGRNGLKKEVKVPEAHRPGLGLAGYLLHHSPMRIAVFGQAEIEFLRQLDKRAPLHLDALLTNETPAVIIARGLSSRELLQICEEREIPLFKTQMQTMKLLARLSSLLEEAFAPTLTCHATLVEVFGVGMMLLGESSVGKSESALGLIERRHRLVADDIVEIKRKEDGHLEGCSPELSKYHMEVRGIGIINVANLYGALSVRDKTRVDLVVHLEAWGDNHSGEQGVLEKKTTDILDAQIPSHVLLVKPGRDVVLLLETIALNHRLKEMGYNSAKEFNAMQLAEIARKEENFSCKK